MSQRDQSAKRRRAGAQRRPEVAGDAEPSNTASHGYEKGKWEYRLLRVGVDSLYLSYYGDLFPQIDNELGQRKYYAQSRHLGEVTLAQWKIGQHVFEVSDKGQQGFAFVLRDNSYRICLRSGQGGKLPVAYVQVSSELLAHKPLEVVADELGEIIEELAESDCVAVVSRIDLYADFQSDTDIGGIRREAWITQASGIDTYSRGGKFTGWVFGAGSALSARIYDKTAEIQKSHKTFFHELWARQGWEGRGTVWRLEFQFRREVLAQFRISALDRLKERLGGLWLHGVAIWLRLAIPDPQDSNRGRWPMHPLWEYLGQIRWRLDDEPLTRIYSPARVPSLEKLFRMQIAILTSYMAIKGIRTYGEALIRLFDDCRDFFEGWCRDVIGKEFPDWLDQKVALKARQFNTHQNVRSVKQDAETSDKVEKDASDYYDKSRGE
jgi:hypothetical protein